MATHQSCELRYEFRSPLFRSFSRDARAGLGPVCRAGGSRCGFFLLQDRRRKRRDRRWIEDFKAGKVPPVSLENAKNGTISLQANGFSVVVPWGKDREATVVWDQVEEIRAFKRDLFSIDLICWGFCCRGDGNFTAVVDEHMAGYKELQKAVALRFGVQEKDWWQKVAFPAFAENMTVIWPVNNETQVSG